MTSMLEPDLSGISQEALDILSGHQLPKFVAREMARMKPERQIEMAEIMVISNDITIPFARALLLTTKFCELKDTHSNHNVGRIIPECDRIAMGEELKALLAEIRSFQEDYVEDALCLVVAIGYLRCILSNSAISDFLSRHYPEIERQLRQLMDCVEADKMRKPEKLRGFVKFKV